MAPLLLSGDAHVPLPDDAALDVHVTNRINPGLAPAQVANVPLGLAMIASFTSQIGDYLVTSSELVFGLPAIYASARPSWSIRW